MATRSPSRRRAGRSRPDIAHSAGQVIGRRGFEETRFADVAAATGTSVSTLQYLYGSREDLLVAALTHCANEFIAQVRAEADAKADPLDRLRTLIGSMLAIGVPLEDARSDWSIWIEYWRAATRDEELREESLRTYESWIALVADAINLCVDAGAIDRPSDVTDVARTTTALIDGYGIQIVLRTDVDLRQQAFEQTMQWLTAALSNSSRTF